MECLIICLNCFLQDLVGFDSIYTSFAQPRSVQDHSMLKADKKMYRTPFEEILFCEALGDYVKVHLTDKVLIVTSTMKKLQSELPEHLFLRTHKSFLINTSHVDYIEGNQIKIGEHMVSIGQSYRKEVIRVLG